MFTSEHAKLIKRGVIGVIPTDTIYGVVGSALKPQAVERIYSLRERDLDKPMIILISDVSMLGQFGIRPDGKTRKVLAKYWPGKVTVILDAPGKKFEYLHRGKNSLAFRLPRNKKLREFLKSTGPLVAPSANPQGKPPARNITEAKKYFGDKVDFYISAGTLVRPPSKIIKISDGKIAKIR